MKIADYIAKHQIRALVNSHEEPSSIPNEAYSKEKWPLPSFIGANTDRTIFVTTYEQKDSFVVYEKDKRRIVGKISEDSQSLS